MLFDAEGPDIPLSLLRAQRAGDLLVIVGAGVSVQAGLPLFGQLADRVYAELGQGLPGAPGSLATQAEVDARRDGQYDRLLGLLEQRVVLRRSDWHQPRNAVRESVAALVTPGRRARLGAHLDVLDLSRAPDGRPRLVTTNFDTLFERAWCRRSGQDLISSAGASMPGIGSHDFTGVMHLHGRIADPRYRQSASDLVLTSANFGEAYMRSGWASRFVYDLLRRYTVLLIGYSADDPPMRYMLEATEEGRLNFPDLRPAFALVGNVANDAGTLREAWRGKGVTPLIYPAPDNDHSGLYRTLGAWADLARDPLSWSRARLAELTRSRRGDATEDERAAFVFLTKEVSSVSVAVQGAEDPSWVEELVPLDSQDGHTFIAWFRERLDVAAAARYAVAAKDPIRGHIARAVDILLRNRPAPLPEPYQQFWQLYFEANAPVSSSPYGRIRSSAGVTAARIQEVVASLEPRLRVRERWRWLESGEAEEGEPATVHDLAQFTLEAPDRSWQQQLDRWPQDAEAEERLLLALDRALSEALELGLDAGLIDAGGDLRSFDLALVHAPDPGEGLLDPLDRHRTNWRLNQPDAHNRRFAPLVRTMTALWRRLAARDARRAGRLAVTWAEREAMIFKRLAAWAAVEGDEGAALRTERYLRVVSRTRYWALDNRPELVRFYCRRWNRLAPQTRRALERAIVGGMLPETIRRFARPGDRTYARALYTVRELARIRTAGGRLSRGTQARLKELYAKFPDLPREMPIYAHLYNPSWSGSGYSADVRVLDEVGDSQLLEIASAIEGADRMEQADLWTVFAQNEPARAFKALAQAAAKGEFPAHRWSPFLSPYAFPAPTVVHSDDEGADSEETDAERADREAAERPGLGEVLEAINRAPPAELGPVAYQLARILETRLGDPDDALFAPMMALWDMLVAVAESPELDEPDRPLAELAYSHPMGMLADSLVSALNAMHLPPGAGLPEILLPRFGRLAGLEGRPGLIARGALIQQLAFLEAIDPAWTEATLMPGLLLEDDDAIDLMSVVANSVATQYAGLFNRLKPAILRALEHDRTDDAAREALSGALVGAAFAVIEGNTAFDLTRVECRQTLTRVSNGVLARMAWELTATLRHKGDAVRRGAYWHAVIAPFLQNYWPNDVSARTPEVSETLVQLPALAGTSFEAAVDVVLDLVSPIGRFELGYGLGLSGDGEDLISRYPRSALKLIAGVLDRASGPPRDLGSTIETLIAADPQIASEPAFWRIRQMLRAD